MKKNVSFCCMFLVGLQSLCLAQVKPMGFNQKVITPQSSYYQYYPKLQIMNDTLFVCSNKGIYQKDLLRDGEWGLYAFKDAPVIEFVRDGDLLLANAMAASNERDSLLLLSRDRGKTFEDYTSPDLLEYGKNHLYRLSQNPQNPKSLLVKTTQYGVYQTYNFGKTWKNLSPVSLGMSIAYANFHPLDTTTIFYSGENPIFSGRIFKSSDSGNTWTEYEVPGGDNCVHQIDFHPSNPNILIFGGEGKIGKSVDKGETWDIKDLYDSGMYFYKVLFDAGNPNLLYASGVRGSINGSDTIYVYRSIDMGETWHLAHKEYLGSDGGQVIDMVKYKDRLIFYTRELGVLELDLKTTSILSAHNDAIKDDLIIYPNPVSQTLRFQTDIKLKSLDIVNSTGSIIQNIVLNGNERSVDVSGLDNGVYLAVFYTGQQRLIKKLCIKR